MNLASELNSSLAHFYGTEAYHFNPLYRWMNYTDGVRYFAENAGGGAYWMLDILGTELQSLARREPFLSIELRVAQDATAQIVAMDGDDNKPVYTRDIDFTDCPQGTWKFFLTNGVLMLPSEY